MAFSSCRRVGGQIRAGAGSYSVSLDPDLSSLQFGQTRSNSWPTSTSDSSERVTDRSSLRVMSFGNIGPIPAGGKAADPHLNNLRPGASLLSSCPPSPAQRQMGGRSSHEYSRIVAVTHATGLPHVPGDVSGLSRSECGLNPCAHDQILRECVALPALFARSRTNHLSLHHHLERP